MEYIFDIIIAATLLISLISGMQKGFIASCLCVLGFIGSWFGAGAIYMNLTQELMRNQTLINALASSLSTTDLINKAAGYVDTMTVAAARENGVFSNVVAELDKTVNLTEFKNAFIGHSTEPIFANFTLKDYLNQTIWQSAFNVIGFLIVFIIMYAVVTLIVNLLNHTFRFPALRGFDSLLGGIFGLVRGYIVVCLIMSLVPSLIGVFSTDVVSALTQNSKLAGFFISTNVDGSISKFGDLFNVKDWVLNLVMALPK